MKAVILAGGFGTRLSEETHAKPKPMVEIGGMPLLWHIMKIYSAHGINEFIICLGYKGQVIRDFFSNYFCYNSSEPWKVTLANTGLHTMTGGRLKRIKKYLENETFCFTYGDTLNDLNIKNLIKFHKKYKKLATVTACQPMGTYGILNMKGNKVINFTEKPAGNGNWINGGFFVLEPKVLDYIRGDTTIWEKEPLEKLAKDGQLYAYKHRGFYHHVDTLREKELLEELWKSRKAHWKVW